MDRTPSRTHWSALWSHIYAVIAEGLCWCARSASVASFGALRTFLHSALLLILNFSAAKRENATERPARPSKHPSRERWTPRTCSRWCSRRSGTLALVCRWALKRASIYAGGERERCARKSSEPACRPLSTLRHPTFFPHRAPYVPAGLTRRYSRRDRKFAR